MARVASKREVERWNLHGLGRGFRVVVGDSRARGKLVIECRGCDDAWTLPKSKQTHPGNLLHLLNHEASHKAGA